MYRPSSGVAVPEELEGTQPPAKSAAKKEWAAYAKSLGATDSEVKSLNRDALAEKYGPKDEEPTSSEPSTDSAAQTQQESPTEAAKEISVATGALDTEDVAGEGEDSSAEAPDDVVNSAQEVAGPPGMNQPSGNASREEWVDFAKSRGATDEELADLGRNDIRDRYSLI
jgi:hypothetical protein